jgi:hypothetical protein
VLYCQSQIARLALSSIAIGLTGTLGSLDLIPNKKHSADPFGKPYESGGCKSLGFLP